MAVEKGKVKGAGAGTAAGSAKRAVRPEPPRTEARRDGWSAGGRPTADAPETPEGPDMERLESDVSQVVADAVRIGYQVIGDNLRQGRAAADRFSAGTYDIGEVPHEIAVLGKRLVQLSRDWGTVWFDLAAAVLRDPAIREALVPQASGKRPRPTPGGGGATPAGSGHVTLSIAFDSSRTCHARPVSVPALKQPHHLVVDAFEPDSGNAPPITGGRLLPGGSPDSAVLLLSVPPRQPAGIYKAVVRDSERGIKLATLHIEVGA